MSKRSKPKSQARGRTAPKGASGKIESLAPAMADGTDRVLTTNQGLRINDDQNSLKAGVRGPTLLEDFILREKITHFDHERIPERVVHARGSAAHGYFQVYESMAGLHQGAHFLQDPSKRDAGVRALLDRRRLARLGRHRARRARLRREVLHRGRRLRPRRQQHPGVLHPGRDQVSRPDPRRQARAAQRDAAGGVGARHLLGLRLADARERCT